jgi:predicted MFS family arabinose efflux permease
VRLADEWFSFFPAGALEPIRQSLGQSYAGAGLLLTSLAAGGLAGNAFAVAADFVDRRWLAAGGAAVYGLCLFACVGGQSLAVLVVAAFCWGAASDAFTHGCEVALVDLYRDELPPVMGRVNAYGAVGDILGPLTLAGAAALGLPWRAVFLLGGAMMLLYALWLAWRPLPLPGTRPAPGAPAPAPGPPASPLRAILDVARDRRILVLALVDGLFGVLDEPFLGFIIASFQGVQDVHPALPTAVATATVGAGLAGFLAVPAFTRRAPGDRLLLPLAALLALATGAFALLPWLPLRILAGPLFGFVGAVFFAVLQATYLGLRPGQAGTSQAVVSTVGLLGLGFPTLAGAVSDAGGLTAGLALYAAAPLAILLLLLLPWRSRRA